MQKTINGIYDDIYTNIIYIYLYIYKYNIYIIMYLYRYDYICTYIMVWYTA